MNDMFLDFFEKSHDYILVFKLVFFSSLFFRNFHHISANWMSHFRKVSFCLLLFQFTVTVTNIHVTIYSFGKGNRKVCICIYQYLGKRNVKYLEKRSDKIYCSFRN